MSVDDGLGVEEEDVGDDGLCHLPNCDEPRVTMTLCAWHADRLLGRRPVEPVEDVEDVEEVEDDEQKEAA